MTTEWDAEVSDDEIRAVVDRMARRRHGISGEEFVRLVRDGQVHELCGGSADIVSLVRLLPEGDFALTR
jgi:hypothetical protein